ncbi:MAG: 16S rRNA (cytidine(1402)-2'-O)-methyltransferase [Spirochaetes bacterium]|nr:16S rRNA (cytidine(1402)-2'-O)-methyltransferase [Spirochaetota bacterium]MBN2770918.1 16S rRNA (cytidine(1402)-2'-O)-methyltransferase [Spirochaetota bacterium]
MENSPRLYVIATPIGNLKDITLRALEVLKEEVSILFCEDTRVSARLLSHYGIHLQLISLHAHSTNKPIDNAIKALKEGKTVAYVSDCGTPGISDPGSKLVEAVSDAGFTVTPLPGASAVTSLISVSGFSGKQFIFAGFISKKPGRRINELTELKKFDGTIVIYESPHRIKKTLEAICEVFPDTSITIGREITKKFEEIIRTNSANMRFLLDNLTEKGEFSIAIHNKL